MSKRINVTLPMSYYEFVENTVKAGTHASRSECVRMALMHYREFLYKFKGGF